MTAVRATKSSKSTDKKPLTTQPLDTVCISFTGNLVGKESKDQKQIEIYQVNETYSLVRVGKLDKIADDIIGVCGIPQSPLFATISSKGIICLRGVVAKENGSGTLITHKTYPGIVNPTETIHELVHFSANSTSTFAVALGVINPNSYIQDAVLSGYFFYMCENFDIEKHLLNCSEKQVNSSRPSSLRFKEKNKFFSPTIHLASTAFTTSHKEIGKFKSLQNKTFLVTNPHHVSLNSIYDFVSSRDDVVLDHSEILNTREKSLLAVKYRRQQTAYVGIFSEAYHPPNDKKDEPFMYFQQDALVRLPSVDTNFNIVHDKLMYVDPKQQPCQVFVFHPQTQINKMVCTIEGQVTKIFPLGDRIGVCDEKNATIPCAELIANVVVRETVSAALTARRLPKPLISLIEEYAEESQSIELRIQDLIPFYQATLEQVTARKDKHSKTVLVAKSLFSKLNSSVPLADQINFLGQLVSALIQLQKQPANDDRVKIAMQLETLLNEPKNSDKFVLFFGKKTELIHLAQDIIIKNLALLPWEMRQNNS